MRVLVIGAGASGMIAALTAAEDPNNRVTLLERHARVGRKLAATGNGRCNLTNLYTDLSRYHGEDPAFITPALEQFGVSDTLRWFRSLGLVTVAEDSGKVYPFSDQAGSVVDVLRLAIEQSDIDLQTGSEVISLTWREDAFFARTQERLYAADRVIIACGGKAGGKLGGTGAGYYFLKGFGHTCTKLYPVLVQLKTDPTWVRSLKGVRAEAEILLTCGEELLQKNRGEVQFAEYGLTGPAIFEISRAVSVTEGDLCVTLDLMPQLTEEELFEELSAKMQRFPALLLENYLTGMVQNRLGRTVIRACGLPLEVPASCLKKKDLRAIATMLKAFRFPVTGTMGMDYAQVTAGGNKTDEFDPRTLESKLIPGLYACGEVLDIDGDCGGLNLQWAWSSGRLAGKLGGTT